MPGGVKKQNVIFPELSYIIIGVLFEVYNELGFGYKEKHYELAIEKLFIQKRIEFRRQVPYKIIFKGEYIGRYLLDFTVENKVILELKTGNYFSRQNIWQVKSYLQATQKQLAILANFTSQGVKYKRLVNIPNSYIRTDS